MMKKELMDESILVCVYFGPNGERLIQRGCRIAQMLNCPLHILTVDFSPFNELDAEKSEYITRWQQLAEEYNAQEFILMDNEKRPVYKVIAEIARKKNVTQIVIGQTAQSRWEQVTKGSIINSLLKEIPFVDLHIISEARYLKNTDLQYAKGVRAYLIREENHYRLIFNHTKDVIFEGIFFKEIETDFNNGLFKFMKGKETLKVQIIDDIAKDLSNIEIQPESIDDFL